MKKKLLLIIAMFIFITNVKALTFDVDVTNIEDKGNGGTIGSIEKIDVNNKSLDVLFQDIGGEVNFEITVTNVGDRAGTLRDITFEPGNDKIEYSSNLPDGGLAINGNDTNKVTVTAKVKEGAVNGKTTSTVKIKYSYDEGSCPDGEILSKDESMCLCPEGMERNENGICVKPEKKIECAENEIYNEQKKICEKKEVTPVIPDKKPINPSNPKTLDNIILITLLFIVSGLGIYAAMFKKLKTNKKRITVGVITGVITLSLSFTVLAGVFGLNNLLSAIVNPITKTKELVITVNEEIDLIETWDGECSLDVSELTPDKIFQGGSGTESDPYQIKTAEQLSCLAKSVNNGTTYEGQYIKQIKNIKLNDHLNDQATNGDLSGAHVWTSAGYVNWDSATSTNIQRDFEGTYDGDNHIISGLYLTTNSNLYPATYHYTGLFGYTKNATFKNMILKDVYMNTDGFTGALVGYSYNSLTIDNVTTYGTGIFNGREGSGLVVYNSPNDNDIISIQNSTNNINMTCNGPCAGFLYYQYGNPQKIIAKNNTNNGNFFLKTNAPQTSGMLGHMSTNSGEVLIENCANNGDITFADNGRFKGMEFGGIIGYLEGNTITLKNSYNTGDITGMFGLDTGGGIAGKLSGRSSSGNSVVIENCYNSGNLIQNDWSTDYTVGTWGGFTNMSTESKPYAGGIVGFVSGLFTMTNSFNSGEVSVCDYNIGGLIGASIYGSGTISNSFNTGNVKGYGYVGGIIGESNNGGNIVSSYNTGTIESTHIGVLGGLAGKWDISVEKSYNAGNLIKSSPVGNGPLIGGISPQPTIVKNSYNTGNITIKTGSFSGSGQVGGIAGFGGTIANTYNSGNITYEGSTSSQTAGICAMNGTITNSYNLGNILINQIGAEHDSSSGSGYYWIGGVAEGDTSNSVNTGNVTLKLRDPLPESNIINMGGIGYYKAYSNNFNAGTISIDDSALQTPISQDGLAHSKVFVGEIQAKYNSGSSGNKFKNANGFALGCYQRGECTLEESQAVGISTEEDAPSILSIINGDDAFEIKEGETLPTLKIFNN